MRFRTTDTNNNGLPALATPSGSFTTSLTHVVYTRASNGDTRLYLDGDQVDSGTTGTINWDPNYRLALGNEHTENRPWLGQLHLIAIYQQALTAEQVSQNHTAGPNP